MARPLQIEYEEAVYHVMSRGNAREKIYWDDAGRLKFLSSSLRII
jgi:hypothetical protein